MRPTPAAPTEAAHPRSRKSSLVGDRRPSISSAQPTSFFLAREEDVFGGSTNNTATTRKTSSSRRSSGSHNSVALEGSMLNSGSEGKTVQQDSMYGVQSLEEALGEAFGQGDVETTTGGLAGLLKRKRKVPFGEGLDKAGTTETSTADDVASKSSSSPQHHHLNATTIRTSRANTVSQPLTPLQLESPVPESVMPSTPKSGSFRSLALSDEEDEAASQAITSAGEEEDDEEAEDDDAVTGSRAEDGDSAPQLVMPSLAMPSRRPFTERGKQMGRLKIAVAGANGVGKTSLIRAIVRQCEDIVHLDPISTPTPTPTLRTPQPGKRSKKAAPTSATATTHITELQASTKAYPAWWSDAEESRLLLRRRKSSTTETVLERNVSFIDSPGFERGSIKFEDQPLVRYLEGLLKRNAAMEGMGSAEVLGVLSGAGGVQIDVVLYVCEPAESISQLDFEYMGKLAKYTNVIPIITKADASPEVELARRKAAIARELVRCNVNANILAKAPRLETTNALEEETQGPQDQQQVSLTSSSYMGGSAPQAPFLVSCLPGSDDGEMDASLLMSPGYSPPLVPSELQDLVAMLFEPDTMAKLRHISARKFLTWRDKVGSEPLALSPAIADSMALGPATGLGIKEHLALARNTPNRRTSSPHGGAARGTRHAASAYSSPFNLSSTATPPIGSGLPDFTRARIRDHIMREERLAQVQLAKWASDLQRSIRREREEYAQLVEGERARWLLARVGEEASQGRIATLGEDFMMGGLGGGKDEAKRALARADWKQRFRRVEAGSGMELPAWARVTAERGMDARDPLGLCGLEDGVRRTGGTVLKVLGGGVLVGAVWVAICRAWGVDPEKWWVWMGWGKWW